MTYEQGENIHVEGSLQQRKFTPADGDNPDGPRSSREELPRNRKHPVRAGSSRHDHAFGVRGDPS